jgi:transcriptional regulator with XRE-family HTH domain
MNVAERTLDMRFSAEKLDRLREAKDLSPSQLMRLCSQRFKLNTTSTHYYNYAKGRSRPALEIAVAMARVLDCQVEDFMEDEANA